MEYTEKQKADFEAMDTIALEELVTVLSRQKTSNGDLEAIMDILDDRMDG